MTTIHIETDRFFVDGTPTYARCHFRDEPIEGLLLNSRMIQATFDDENPETVHRWAYPDSGTWDAARNVAEFIEALPIYRDHGLLAVTLNFQGGSPEGYSKEQPWHNSPASPIDLDRRASPSGVDELRRWIRAPGERRFLRRFPSRVRQQRQRSESHRQGRVRFDTPPHAGLLLRTRRR